MAKQPGVGLPVISDFISDIDGLVANGGLTHLDAVVYWCEQRGIEPESAGEVIRKHPKLKKKIQAEAEVLNCMKKKR